MNRPADLAAWIALLAVVPIAAIVMSCYVKIAVVLSVLRGALGNGIPPRSVSFAIALLLSAFVMAPLAGRVWSAAAPALDRGDAASLAQAASSVRAPVAEFLTRHAPERERRSFLELARRLRPAAERDTVAADDLTVLASAFVFAELRAAFQVGFLLYLPFLVLELVIASLLTTLGMHTLDPRAVSLPFKLLLFVVADGWHLLARGLILGYA